jgi:hypothetical protein
MDMDDDDDDDDDVDLFGEMTEVCVDSVDEAAEPILWNHLMIQQRHLWISSVI